MSNGLAYMYITGVHFDIFENVKFTCFVFLHELIDMIHVYFKIF